MMIVAVTSAWLVVLVVVAALVRHYLVRRHIERRLFESLPSESGPAVDPQAKQSARWAAGSVWPAIAGPARAPALLPPRRHRSELERRSHI